MRLLIAILALSLLGNCARAASVQARLIRATNDDVKQEGKLKDIEPELRKTFGYAHYQQLGAERASLDKEKCHRLNLGEGFVVFIRPKACENKTHEFEAEWTSGKVSLVKTTVKVPEKKSIFIRGPEVGKDWIVLSLTVQEK